MECRRNKIAPLHDALRWSFSDGRIFMTDGLEPAVRAKIRDAVLTFAHFSTDDPYGEHDFGSIEVDGVRAFFEIDYHDQNDPAGHYSSGSKKIGT